jgi:hypothetical protein
MPRLASLILSLGLVGLLSACVFPGAGKTDPEGVTANAVTGSEIEVTALDALPSGPEAAPAAIETPPGPDDGTKAQATAPEGPAEPAVKTLPEPAPQPDLEEAMPEVVKSDLQLACEKKKGRWASTGGKSHICLFNTKDAGKQCTRESQCEGACLARSGTCSPIRPLLGCNEILQDDGARVTLCIN